MAAMATGAMDTAAVVVGVATVLPEAVVDVVVLVLFPVVLVVVVVMVLLVLLPLPVVLLGVGVAALSRFTGTIHSPSIQSKRMCLKTTCLLQRQNKNTTPSIYQIIHFLHKIKRFIVEA